MNKYTYLKLLLVFFFLGASFFRNELNAQSVEIAPVYNRSIGIDAAFINNFLPLENDIGVSSGYLIHGMKFNAKNTVHRHAFDISYRNREDLVNQTRVSDINFSTEYKYGLGKRRGLLSKLFVMYGVELGGSYSYGFQKRLFEDSDGSDSRRLQNTYLAFIGPFLALEYRITSRIGVMTEGFYHLSFTKSNNSNVFLNDPGFDSESSSRNVSSSLRYPRSIVVFYNF